MWVVTATGAEIRKTEPYVHGQSTNGKYSNRYFRTNSVWDDGGDPYNKKMIMAHAKRDGNFLTNYFGSK